jgi:hypothetical protein
MHGLVNQGIQDLAVDLGGEELWQKIKRLSGVEVEAFVALDSYPDEITDRLVRAAATALELSPTDVLRVFGRHWIRYTARKGYGAMIDTLGRTLPEFLGNLDAMHTRLRLTMPGLRSPSFVCTESEPGRLIVQYWSARDGLAPMSQGILEGLGDVFHIGLVVTQTVHKGAGTDHDEFLVEYSPVPERTSTAEMEDVR